MGGVSGTLGGGIIWDCVRWGQWDCVGWGQTGGVSVTVWDGVRGTECGGVCLGWGKWDCVGWGQMGLCGVGSVGLCGLGSDGLCGELLLLARVLNLFQHD